MEYWKDGKKVECGTIYGHGHVGQVVILDHVGFGKNPDFEQFPLARYSQPYAFTIAEKIEGKGGYYIVVDAEGNRITLRDQDYGASVAYLYDGNEWLVWQKKHAKDKLARKEHKIDQLQAHLDLLKNILTKQGFRVITNEQAETLGIA